MRRFTLASLALNKDKTNPTFIPVTDLTNGINAPGFKAVIAAADKDQHLDGIVSKKTLEDAIVFMCAGEIVGVNIPRVSRVVGGEKIIRVGPIYVVPEFRGHQIAAKYLKEAFSESKAEAYIEPENAASRTAFTQAGFKTDGKPVKLHGETFFHYKNF